MKISKGTIIRTTILIIALINQILSASGHSVLPIEDKQVEEFISVGFTIVTSLIAWWKNNSFTQNAIEADKFLSDLRSDE